MALLLGLDIGGTKSAAVIGDTDGNVLARASAPTPRGSWQEAVALLCGLVREVCHGHGVAASDMAALSVSCGGPLDSATGIVYAPPNLPAAMVCRGQTCGLPERDADALAAALKSTPRIEAP